MIYYVSRKICIRTLSGLCSEILVYGWMVFPNRKNILQGWLRCILSLNFSLSLFSRELQVFVLCGGSVISPCGILSRPSSSCAYSQLTGCSEVLLFFLFPEKLKREENQKRGSTNRAGPYGKCEVLVLVDITW